MLTPERIKQFDEITGFNTPTDAIGTAAKSRADEIRAKYGPKPAVGEDGTVMGGTTGKFLSGLGERFKERGKNVIAEAKDIKTEVDTVGPEAGGMRALASGAGAAKLAGRTVGQVAGGVGDIFMEAIKAVTPDELEQKVSDKLSSIIGNEKVRPVVESIYNLAKKYPEAAKDAETLVNVLTLGGAGVAERPVKELVEQGVKAGKELLETGVKNVSDMVLSLTAKSEQQIEKAIVKKFEKGVKPLIPGKTTPSQPSNYRDDVLSAVKTIDQNKPKLSFSDEAGEAVVGRNPQSLQELNEAVEQTKKIVFQQYDDLAKQAGEAGVKIELNPIADELDAVINNRALNITNPSAIKYAEETKDRLVRAGNLDAQTAQDVIQNYNKSLEAFYRNPSYETASRASIDAMIANRMRKVLDDGISGLTGKEYQALKNQYGALKTIERDVIKASLRDARKNVKGLIDFADILSGGQVVGGILSLNPAQIAAGVTQKGITEFYKFLNNPNRAIKKMFEAVEKLPIKQ